MELLVLQLDHWLMYFELKDMFLIYKGRTECSNLRSVRIFDYTVYIQFPGVLKVYSFHLKNGEMTLRIGQEYSNPICATDLNELCIWHYKLDKFWVSFLSVRIENNYYDFMSMMKISRYSKMSSVGLMKAEGGVQNHILNTFLNKLFTVSRFNYLSGWDIVSSGNKYELFKYGYWELPYKGITTCIREMDNNQYLLFGTQLCEIFLLNVENMIFVHTFKTDYPVHDILEERRDHPEIFLISIAKTYKSMRKFKLFQKTADRIYREYDLEKFPIFGFKDKAKIKDEELIEQRTGEEFSRFRYRILKFKEKLEDQHW